MSDPDLDNLGKRMDGAVKTLKSEFAGLRTGRASPNLLDPVTVEVYGQTMPITQVGTVSVPEPRLISVTVWDKSMAKAVEKAIREAGLGLNPQPDGQYIRIPIPELNQERRQELTRIAGKYAEQARIAIRNVRRDGMDQLKKLEKESAISQDDQKLYGEEIQTLTDDHIKTIDETLAQKEKEIMQV